MTADVNPPSNGAPGHLEGAYSAPKIIYIAYLIGLVFPLAALGGVVYAYIAKGKDAGADTHLKFQIRTFWWGLLAAFVGAILALFLVGYLVLLAWIVWVLTRCITGLQLAGNDAPISEIGPMGFTAK